MRFRKRSTLDHLLGDGRDWARLEATILVGRTAADLADAERDLIQTCERSGVTVEFMAGADNLRIYRLAEGR